MLKNPTLREKTWLKQWVIETDHNIAAGCQPITQEVMETEGYSGYIKRLLYKT